jgi:hypothetical protein
LKVVTVCNELGGSVVVAVRLVIVSCAPSALSARSANGATNAAIMPPTDASNSRRLKYTACGVTSDAATSAAFLINMAGLSRASRTTIGP